MTVNSKVKLEILSLYNRMYRHDSACIGFQWQRLKFQKGECIIDVNGNPQPAQSRHNKQSNLDYTSFFPNWLNCVLALEFHLGVKLSPL